MRKITGMRTCAYRWVWGWALELHAFGVVLLRSMGGASCDPLFAGSWDGLNGMDWACSFLPSLLPRIVSLCDASASEMATRWTGHSLAMALLFLEVSLGSCWDFLPQSITPSRSARGVGLDGCIPEEYTHTHIPQITTLENTNCTGLRLKSIVSLLHYVGTICFR